MVGKKQEELEFHLPIQNDGIIGINCQVAEQLESWDLVMDGCKLRKRPRQERGVRVALYVKEQLECTGLMCDSFDSI